MNDSSGKLYFLRDRGRRPTSRHPRKRADGSGAGEAERHRPSAQETVWLARGLAAEAAYIALFSLGLGTGLVDAPGDVSRTWLHSLLLADLFVAVLSALAAYELLRSGGRRDFFVLLASGSVVFLSLQQIALGVMSSVRQELTPWERLSVVAAGVCLAVGIWAASHSRRMRRGGD